MSEITLLHVHNRAMGYGRLGVDLAAALTAAGVDVYDDIGTPPVPRQVELPAEAPVSTGNRCHEGGPTNVASWVSTPSHADWWWEGQYTSIFTMWEASVLPAAFRDTLHNLDLVIVPSEQNLELFSLYHGNVKYVPLGVDPARWHPVDRTESPFFTFLIGGSGPRKGTDLAFYAFRKVFGDWTGDGPIPRLVMKNPKGESKFRGYDRVDMISGRLTDEDEETLYASANVYLQPSRGEGFGLQPLQAMAQGIPTILTDAHGQAAFAKHAIPLGYGWSKADYFIFGDAGDWWEPDFEQLCEAMWDTYHNYPDHLARAQQVARDVIPAEFTWATVARRYIDAHDGQLDVPYTGSGGYTIPDSHKYEVRVLTEHRADIAGQTHFWFPGKVYYEPAETKRLLFEVGVLDPACFAGDDHGLSDRQVTEIGAYTAAREWCPTCRQQLGSRPTKADAIYEQMQVDAENQAALVAG